jgi:lipoprotein NlpI
MFVTRLAASSRMCQSIKLFLRLALLFAINLTSTAQEANGNYLQRAKKAYSEGQRDEAAALAGKAIQTEPKNPNGYLVRAQLYQQANDADKALTDYDQALELDPSLAAAWQNRGILQFKLGHIDKSIHDFNQFLKLMPAQAPYHWQRGICLYYAGRFEEGRKQFELHQTVNANDVENAVWHFLCVVRLNGLQKARATLIPIREDARVPMMQIHALFAGVAKTEDVLNATRAGEPDSRELKRRQFYAHLYLGLYEEAIGNETQAQVYITKAVQEYQGADYMSDVARVHLTLRQSKKKS